MSLLFIFFLAALEDLVLQPCLSQSLGENGRLSLSYCLRKGLEPVYKESINYQHHSVCVYVHKICSQFRKCLYNRNMPAFLKAEDVSKNP